MALAAHDLGGAGPVLLMLHANGFNGQMFLPLARALHASFRCIAFDMPGHGESSSVRPPLGYTPEHLTDLVYVKIQAMGLEGCYVFGHSLGGAIALLLEARRPGTFAAVYAYEPVLATTATLQAMTEAKLATPPLAAMALRRRRAWPSRAVMAAALSARPPFGEFTEDVVRLYVAHGARDVAGSSSGEVELVCDPEFEATVYNCMDPPPVLDTACVEARVTIAVGRRVPGHVHERITVLSGAVAAALGRGGLERFEDLGHLGPYEAPERVAASVRARLTPAGSSWAAEVTTMSKL
ncbi:hypothetical protein FOA52_012277 [Chlamydomonas sp. UWO 241]|nr:hypothetical protein FOA52_012277 [Chlamydomonas sp. UWO 241]